MAAMLNGDQFFHGTTFHIPDVVRPADAVDKFVSEYSMGDPGDMSEGDHAFVIRNDERYAWHAATTFRRNGRRPRVYETDPASDMKPGPWNKDHPNFLEHHELDIPEGMEVDQEAHDREVAKARANHQDEWGSTTGFPVRRRIDIMPGRQGTFPEFNWNRFKEGGHRGWSIGYEANHPTDEQVRYGMKGHPQEQGHPDLNKAYGPREKAQRRTGRSLRAFMEGKPEPADDSQGRLF